MNDNGRNAEGSSSMVSVEESKTKRERKMSLGESLDSMAELMRASKARREVYGNRKPTHVDEEESSEVNDKMRAAVAKAWADLRASGALTRPLTTPGMTDEISAKLRAELKARMDAAGIV